MLDRTNSIVPRVVVLTNGKVPMSVATILFCGMLLRVVDAAVSREAMAAIMKTSSQNSTVVLVGSSAGGIGAMNVASWLLDSFEQVRLRRTRHGKVGVEL